MQTEKTCRSTSYDDYKKREKQSKKLLRAFNAETDYYLTNVRMNNVDTYRNKSLIHSHVK